MSEKDYSELRRRDRIEVRIEDEDRVLYNWATTVQRGTVRGGNPETDMGRPTIRAGDSPEAPDAITSWLAETIRDHFHIDPEIQGIDVIDPEDDNVEVYW